MKIKILALILAVFCLSTLLVGCNEKPCEAHVDANMDDKCDNENCDFEYCAVHKDENADLTCDVCAKAITKCEFHKDVIVDNVCDVCKLPISVKCDVHKDDDLNKVCDICGGVIVTVIEQVPPTAEERVDMVVNPIPGNVDLGNYFVTDKQEPDYINDATLVKFTDKLATTDTYWLLSIYDEETEITTYKIYEFATGNTIYSVTNDIAGEENTKYVSITLYDNYYTVYIKVEKVIAEEYYTYTDTTDVAMNYYTYTGTKICGTSWNYELNYEESYSDKINALIPSEYTLNNVKYITFGDKVWAFDMETGAQLGVFDETNLVHRPAFDAVVDGKYGIVEYEKKLFVYDLTKWIECIYSYKLPTATNGYEWFVLANGTILVQYENRVYVGANYDYLDGAVEYDISYVIIDIAAKTAKSVEFGYQIVGILAPGNVFTDKVQNIAIIRPIVNDTISTEHAVVALNNDLTIAADLTPALSYTLAADGIFYVNEYLDESTFATYMVDVNGNKIAYIPYGATIYNNAIYYDGNWYSMDMKLLLDAEASGYSVVFENQEYAILSKYDEENDVDVYYFYDMASGKISAIKYQNYEGFGITYMDGDYGYVVSYLQESEDPTVASEMKYVLYNLKNEAIKTFTANVANIYEEVNGTTVIVLADGRVFTAK